MNLKKDKLKWPQFVKKYLLVISQYLGDRGRGISASSRPACSTEVVLGQLGLHKVILSQKMKGKQNQNKKKH